MLPAVRAHFFGVCVVAFASCRGGCERTWRPLEAGAVVSPSGVRALEPTVAVGPAGEVAVAWIEREGNASFIGARIGRAHGAEWTAPQRLGGPGPARSDPSIASDGAGGFVLAWLAFEPDVVPRHVGVFAAHGLGAPPVRVSEEDPSILADRPSIARTGSGRIHVAYAFARGDRAGVVVATSTTAREWTRATLVDRAGPAGLLPFACASADRAWVAYYDPAHGVAMQAIDGSATTIDAHAAAEAPSCAADADAIWVAYGKSSDAPSTRESAKLDAVVVAASRDGGKTFATREYRDQAAGRFLMHPALARDATGAVWLAYYAGDDARGTFRAVRVDDPWPPSVSLGSAPFVASRESATWGGDYAGLAGDGDGVVAAFAQGAQIVLAQAGRARVQ